jgi:hypothetical protein
MNDQPPKLVRSCGVDIYGNEIRDANNHVSTFVYVPDRVIISHIYYDGCSGFMPFGCSHIHPLDQMREVATLSRLPIVRSKTV